MMKTKSASHEKKGKREYLNDSETSKLIKGLNGFFESVVNIERMRNGEHQEIETLINEEALLFAKHLRGENKAWLPRVPYTFSFKSF